ncbi:glycosyltransferase involved in cell wall biosynthesis [Sinomonas atrocyanea]|uniref:glycosyltransferase n=1 Tax=Sinomonas atrocyanea TaxID=37927 RepID=UPI00278AF2BF|nr:glycosyltransferase [Sinomonas atrocyanea]MDP9884145.1 glycosyltransferase involved in cell wall biosynthesis [Sinomonas atrocyanea]
MVPDGLGYTSGGTVYNTQLAEALSALGADVEVVAVPGEWPVGSAEDRRRLAAALAPAHDGGSHPPHPSRPEGTPAAGAHVLVDGLLALGAPDEVASAVPAVRGGGGRFGILVHLLLADAAGLSPEEAERLAGLERRALAAADVALVPSDFSARRLAERYGMVPGVVRPGVVGAPAAGGSLADGGIPHVLCLAALLPGKGQLRLVRALAALRDRPWTLTLAGYDAADRAYARAVRDAAADLGIAERVRVPGELRGDALDAEWSVTDLTVLASDPETYGLAVVESLARGIPAIVAAGTGAVEALGLSLEGGFGTAGAAVEPPGNAGLGAADPLARKLAGWLDDPSVRARWRAAALAARPLLPGWESTGRAVLRALSPASAGS